MHPITCSPVDLGLPCNEKVGLRPLVCLAKCWYYTTVLSFLIYAREGGKDKRSTGETRAQSPLWLRLEFELSRLSYPTMVGSLRRRRKEQKRRRLSSSCVCRPRACQPKGAMDRTTSILRLCRSCLRLQKQERQSGDYPRQGSQYERPRRANGVNARPGNRHEERIGSLGLDTTPSE